MVNTRDLASVSPLTDDDLFLFNEGSHYGLYNKLGSRRVTLNGRDGIYFAVWAPNARGVSVIGSFNGWRAGANPMMARGVSGIWETFLPKATEGDAYKYHIESRHNGYVVDKTDPFGFEQEIAPRTASRIRDLSYTWGDAEWMHDRGRRQRLEAPISVYEMHVGSWMRELKDGSHLSYLQLADLLPRYLVAQGFTHVQFLPITEHPFYGSWGYGTTGYFAATSRYGSPQDLMTLIDALHQAGIGVFLDWVPAHFPSDQSALGYFDGTWLYEHADPRKGKHPDWNTLIYNYGRNEVRSFLISSAMFWLEQFHIDGLRVDAVASMLYLDYSRDEGGWEPNQHGGKENLEAIDFLRQMNEAVYGRFPDIQMIAEESTSWPMVSKPTWLGGLGFGMKWDMGWMHDTLEYFAADPLVRRYQHNQVTFRQIYSDAENFMLPLSHDEVVHGKRSLLHKMAGDEWQRFSNLRTLYAWMFAQNGKKLLFMGSEIAAQREWDHESSLDWGLLEKPRHAGVHRLMAALNRLYRGEKALYELDHERRGFEWIDCRDAEQSVVALLRKGNSDDDRILVVLNFTPVPRDDYRVGVPRGGRYHVLLDTDAPVFGGSGYAEGAAYESEDEEWHGRRRSIVMKLPPLAAIFLKPDPGSDDELCGDRDVAGDGVVGDGAADDRGANESGANSQ